MIRIDPKTFKGPRAYFTDFDHRIVARTGNLQALRLKGERKLKILLLLKGQVVCAASHLASKFAYDFFRENPELLTSGSIAPAFRSDKSDLEELFVRKRFRGKESAVRFYKDSIKKTVDWELGENSMWFRDRFLADMEDEHSVVRRHLSNNAKQNVSQLVEEIRRGSLLGRDLIDKHTRNLSRKERRILQSYRELLYHMSGARVVHCESSLPQENYVDYDLADLSQKRARLSEDQILTKLFIELVLDSMQKSMLPVELIDLLSFRDIFLIREPLLSSNFQDKYDQLIRRAVSSHSAEPGKIFDLEELEKIRDNLSKTFEIVLKEQLPRYLKRKALGQSRQLASVSASVALGVAGAVPGFGLVASAVSVMKDTPALLVNIGQTYRSVKSVSDMDIYYHNKEQLLRKQVEQSNLTDKAIFYEVVELLLKTISQRIRL